MKKMRFSILCAVALVCSFVCGVSLTEAASLPKIQAVRSAAQPDNPNGEKVWRYVIDFSDAVKKKPEIKGNVILLPGVDLKAQQGKSFGSGTIPPMKIGKANNVVALTITPKAGQNLEYKVFALAAAPERGQKERIVVEMTEKKGEPVITVQTLVVSTKLSENGYSIQRIKVDLGKAVNGTIALDDSESGVMVVTMLNAPLGVKEQSHTIDGGESVTRVRIAPDGKNTDIILPMSTYFEKPDIKVSVTAGDEKKKTTTVVQLDVRQKLPDYKYSVTGGLKGKIIAIDPGHGGSDPGAVGLNGTTEKAVNLAVAKKLGDKLAAAGATVVYTRTTDVDVAKPFASGAEELHKRIDVAHNAKADLFISIHADAALSREANGSTIYYFPKTPYDLNLAEAIRKRAAYNAGVMDRGSKEANFYVIKKSWIPGVLVETAFLSNPAEEKLLGQAEFQDKMATGIFDGIVDFYKMGGTK